MILEKTHRLILKNDDENSYLLVIAALVRFCNHDKEQAEQCAIITHNNGQCDIKSGSFMDMMEIQSGLTDIGLDVVIEEYEGSMH